MPSSKAPTHVDSHLDVRRIKGEDGGLEMNYLRQGLVIMCAHILCYRSAVSCRQADTRRNVRRGGPW
jgi:hypothetical protein